jgi:hypothetical protein
MTSENNDIPERVKVYQRFQPKYVLSTSLHDKVAEAPELAQKLQDLVLYLNQDPGFEFESDYRQIPDVEISRMDDGKRFYAVIYVDNERTLKKVSYDPDNEGAKSKLTFFKIPEIHNGVTIINFGLVDDEGVKRNYKLEYVQHSYDTRR